MKPSKTRFAPQPWWCLPRRGALWGLATHADHDALLVGSQERVDALWFIDGGVARCAGDVPGDLRAVAWADAHTAVLVVEMRTPGQGAGPGSVIMRDVRGAVADRVVAEIPLCGYRCTLTVDRAGRRAVVNSHRAVYLVDLHEGRAREIEAYDDDAGVICGAISPDGARVLAVCNAVAGARLFDADTGAPLSNMAGAVRSGVVAACFDPTGRTVAAITLGAHMLVVWNVSDGSVRFVRDGACQHPPALAFSPDGTHLALSEHGRRVTLLDARDGRVVSETKLPGGYALRLVFSRDGRALFATVGAEVFVIPTTSPAPAAPVTDPAAFGPWTPMLAGNHVGYLTGGCVDRSGRTWAVGSDGRALTSHDDATWRPVKLPRRPNFDGVCAGDDGTLWLYGQGFVLTARDGGFEETRLRGRPDVVAMASTREATLAASREAIFVLDRETGAWRHSKPAALEGGWHRDLAIDDRGVFLLASGMYERGFVAASTDAARTWTLLPLEGCAALHCVACAGDAVYVGGDRGALYRSDDRGARWERLDAPPGLERETWRALVARGDVVYAAASDDTVWRSGDRGAQWTRVLRADVRRLLWTPRGHVLGVGAGPIFRRSEDLLP
jgi:photosystem II stability/assembly factor-like uncharacterized protein